MHPHGVIVEAHTGVTRRWRGGPGADPMPVVVHRLSPPVATRVCVMTTSRPPPLLATGPPPMGLGAAGTAGAPASGCGGPASASKTTPPLAPVSYAPASA